MTDVTRTPNQILLRGDAENYEEGVLDTVASPGMALELQSDGKYDQVQSTSAEAAKARVRLLREDRLQGKTVDDAYAIGDVAQMYPLRRGDRVQVLVKSGQTVAVGANGVVEGGGSGLFIVAAGSETNYHVEFTEASGGALAANTLLAAEVL